MIFVKKKSDAPKLPESSEIKNISRDVADIVSYKRPDSLVMSFWYFVSRCEMPSVWSCFEQARTDSSLSDPFCPGELSDLRMISSVCACPNTAVLLCGEHGSVRSRRSAWPLHAVRRPAVRHQPASLPPRRLLLLHAHARVLRISQNTEGLLFYCQYLGMWSISGRTRSQ